MPCWTVIWMTTWAKVMPKPIYGTVTVKESPLLMKEGKEKVVPRFFYRRPSTNSTQPS